MEKEEKIWICYPVNGKQKAKYSYGILENNSEVYSKASATKGLLVKFYYNYVKQD
jgi:hypothetical protein